MDPHMFDGLKVLFWGAVILAFVVTFILGALIF